MIKPKMLHWYVLAYTDIAPEVGLCVSPKELEFLVPDDKNGKTDYFNPEQIIADLGPLQIPKVPAKLKKFRVAEE